MKIKILMLAFLLAFGTYALRAQDPADSVALVNADWRILKSPDGMICKKADLKLWNTDQEISYVEFQPGKYHPYIVQFDKRTPVRKISKQTDAKAAINGGYFVTKTQKAIANDFLKVQDSIYATAGGWGNAAVAIDKDGNLHFSMWGNTEENMKWQQQYPDVLGVGPLLLLDNQTITPWNGANQDRHPRSCIGTKPDGTIVMFVVDGRQPGADGMSFPELAYTAHILGLNSAINLDGGGSSTLWCDGSGNVNHPSDNLILFRIPRAVCNAIVVK